MNDLSVLVVARNPIGGIRTFWKYVYPRLTGARFRFTFAVASLPEGHFGYPDLSGLDARIEATTKQQADGQLLRLVLRLLARERFDLIHSHGARAAVIASAANAVRGLPHIATFHEVLRREMVQGFRGLVIKRLLTSVSRTIDRLHLVSNDAHLNLREFLPAMASRAQPVVIPNGIDTAPFLRVAQRRGGDGPARGCCLKFGFLGRFMPQKGFDTLIDATAQFISAGGVRTPLKVIVVSDGGFGREFRAHIERRGLKKHFEFRGFAPCIADTLRELDAVVIPSRWEAGPLLPMEALTAGCPVIASRCIGLREVVQGSPAITVNPGVPSELAAAMEYVAVSRERMWHEALDYVVCAATRFDAHRVAARLSLLIQELLGFGPAVEQEH